MLLFFLFFLFHHCNNKQLFRPPCLDSLCLHIYMLHPIPTLDHFADHHCSSTWPTVKDLNKQTLSPNRLSFETGGILQEWFALTDRTCDQSSHPGEKRLLVLLVLYRCVTHKRNTHTPGPCSSPPATLTSSAETLKALRRINPVQGSRPWQNPWAAAWILK